MEDIEPSMLQWAEDICEVCGAHVGHGIRLFHLDRCDEHAKSYDEGSGTETWLSDESFLTESVN